VCGHFVGIERIPVFPDFENREVVASGGLLEHVVSDAAFLFPAFPGDRFQQHFRFSCAWWRDVDVGHGEDHDHRQIVGLYLAGGTFHGFLLNKGTFTTIDVPGATRTQAGGINDRGQIVGDYLADGVQHGFRFDGGIFVTTDVPTGTATQAVGINDRGEIVGVYTSAGRSHGFVLD